MEPLEIKDSTMDDLVTRLYQNKLSKGEDLFYFIDMGYEFYIFKGEEEENREMLYQGNMFSFIQEMMEHFNVKDYDQ